MREVQSSDAKAGLPQLLDEVERGETIVIIRHGRPIARLVPETDGRTEQTLKTMERIALFRQSLAPVTVDEILSARHEGHRY